MGIKVLNDLMHVWNFQCEIVILKIAQCHRVGVDSTSSGSVGGGRFLTSSGASKWRTSFKTQLKFLYLNYRSGYGKNTDKIVKTWF